jgi:hypothetical protein
VSANIANPVDSLAPPQVVLLLDDVPSAIHIYIVCHMVVADIAHFLVCNDRYIDAIFGTIRKGVVNTMCGNKT